MNQRLAALLAAELDGIANPHERALRLAELIDGCVTSWTDTYDERGYRETLAFAAQDLRRDAGAELETEREAEARDAQDRREALYARMDGVAIRSAA